VCKKLFRWVHTKLLSSPFSKLYFLYNSCWENPVTNPNSNQYKLTAIVLDITRHRLFKHVDIKKDDTNIHFFLKRSFVNRCIDILNLRNFLMLKDQTITIITYVYILQQLQPRSSTTNTCCRVPTLTTVLQHFQV